MTEAVQGVPALVDPVTTDVVERGLFDVGSIGCGRTGNTGDHC
ncbi:hypothetical protein RMN57_00295 [Kitasatospora sp. CM 4170]|nr:hypothetical protein [Kitasatospora sp. CM 4170]WNM43249.1 hypothetical protein RMN57_00295 [Kitasatospora sp. CM 4170]